MLNTRIQKLTHYFNILNKMYASDISLAEEKGIETAFNKLKTEIFRINKIQIEFENSNFPH